MICYWEYCCDFGHSWTLLRDGDAEEQPGDELCPLGHEAVTLAKRPLADRVQVTIRPAARLDPIRDQVECDDRFFLVIADPRTGEERATLLHYTWTEAMLLAAGLHDRGLTRARSWAYLDRIDGLGRDWNKPGPD